MKFILLQFFSFYKAAGDGKFSMSKISAKEKSNYLTFLMLILFLKKVLEIMEAVKSEENPCKCHL